MISRLIRKSQFIKRKKEDDHDKEILLDQFHHIKTRASRTFERSAIRYRCSFRPPLKTVYELTLNPFFVMVSLSWPDHAIVVDKIIHTIGRSSRYTSARTNSSLGDKLDDATF